MFNRYLTYYKTSVQLLTIFMLLLLSFLFVFGIDKLLIPWLTNGIAYEDFSNPENFKIPAYVQAHRIIQLITQIFVFIIPSLVFAYLAFPKPLQYLKATTKINWRHIVIGIGVMGLSVPFINLLEHFNKLIPLTQGMQEIEETAKLVTEAFLTTNSVGDMIFNVVIFVVVAAIGEELFFRGVLQNIIISSKTFNNYPFVAIAVTAIIFSLFHGQMSGLIPRFYAGFLLGSAYYFSNNILVPILMHALNNGVVLMAFYLSKSNYEDPIGVLDYKDFLEIVPLTIFSVILLYKFYQKRATYIIDKVDIDSDETHFLANK